MALGTASLSADKPEITQPQGPNPTPSDPSTPLKPSDPSRAPGNVETVKPSPNPDTAPEPKRT